MSSTGKLMKILRRSVLVSGAVARSVIGIGATALLFLALKKRKKKQKVG
jgi:hypothetical protein